MPDPLLRRAKEGSGNETNKMYADMYSRLAYVPCIEMLYCFCLNSGTSCGDLEVPGHDGEEEDGRQVWMYLHRKFQS